MCFRLPEDLRPLLSAPLGRLIEGAPERVFSLVKSSYKPGLVITVGDVVTGNAVRLGLRVTLGIIDRRTLRRAVSVDPLLRSSFDHVLVAYNPPGMVTCNAIAAIASSLEAGGSTLILVKGEEDLLALPAVLLAPTGSLVLYGQPHRGVVVIKVDEGFKKLCRDILCKFEVVKCVSPVDIGM